MFHTRMYARHLYLEVLNFARRMHVAGTDGFTRDLSAPHIPWGAGAKIKFRLQ